MQFIPMGFILQQFSFCFFYLFVFEAFPQISSLKNTKYQQLQTLSVFPSFIIGTLTHDETDLITMHFPTLAGTTLNLFILGSFSYPTVDPLTDANPLAERHSNILLQPRRSCDNAGGECVTNFSDQNS